MVRLRDYTYPFQMWRVKKFLSEHSQCPTWLGAQAAARMSRNVQKMTKQYQRYLR